MIDEETLANLRGVWPDAADFEQAAIAELFELADLVEDIQRRIKVLAEASGMPALHFYVLEQLALEGGQAPLSELVDALDLPKQSATYMVDRLEGEAYVERQRDPADRRRFQIVLTRKGRRKVKSNLPRFYKAMLDALRQVPAEGRAQLLRSLAQFRDELGTSGAST